MIFSFPYIFFVLSYFFLYYLPKSIGKSEYYYYPQFFILFSLLVFIGCRGFIVTDWVSYYPFFKQTPTIFEPTFSIFLKNWPWEKGFIFTSCLIKSFTDNYFVYQFLLFLIDLIIIDKIIRTYVHKNYYVIAYISFFVFQGFIIEVNLLRNSKAIMFFLLSIKYIQKKNFLKYISLNFLGILFHVSAALYIPLYFILGHTFSKKTLLLFFFIGNFIFWAHISWISGVLLTILPLLGDTRFVSLINSYKILTEDAEAYVIGIGYFERFFTYLLVVYFQTAIIKKKPQVLPFINMLYFFSYVYLFLSEFSIFTQRFSMLFVASYWIVIPTICTEIKKNKQVFILLLFFYCILKMLVQCDEPNYKYTNVLFKQQNYEQSYSVFMKSRKL